MADNNFSNVPTAQRKYDRSPRWWIWPVLLGVCTAAAIVGLLPGFIALRGFESQQAAWLADQNRRAQFRVEAQAERLTLDQSLAAELAKILDLTAQSDRAAEVIRSQQPVVLQLEQARKEVENIRQERNAILAKVAQLSSEQEELTRSTSSMESQKVSLSAVLSDLKALQAEREQLVKDLATISVSVTETRSSLSTLTDQLIASRGELSRLSAEKLVEATKLAAAKGLQQQAGVAEVAVQQRQQQADRLKSDVATLQQKLDGLRANFEDEVKQQVATRALQKQEREADLKKQSDSRELSSGATESLALRQQSQLTQINTDIQAATTALNGLREQESDLRRQIQVLAADQQAAVAKINTFAPLLGTSFAEFNQQLKKLVEQVARLTPVTVTPAADSLPEKK